MQRGVLSTIEGGFAHPLDWRLDNTTGCSSNRAAHENLTPASHRTNPPIESTGVAVAYQASIVIRCPSRTQEIP